MRVTTCAAAFGRSRWMTPFVVAVRERRLTLGLSQTEVAARAGMTQPARLDLKRDPTLTQGLDPTSSRSEVVDALHTGCRRCERGSSRRTWLPTG